MMERKVIEETNRFFQKVYAWMFFGLLISGFTAYYVASSPFLLGFIFSSMWVFYGLLALELALVFGLAWKISKIPGNFALLWFFFYCFVTGLTLSVIFLVYTISSIGLVFLVAAGMFGVMSVIGYFAKIDLTGMGQVLIMGLFGLIIASFANLFMKNSQLDFVLSIIGVIIFTGLTAYDTQKIRKRNILGNEGTDEDLKESILGALTLYLDFVNLFLKLLRLLGKRK